jgi:long-chain acyl-CoA synthetase
VNDTTDAPEASLADIPRLLASLPRRISDIAAIQAARAPDTPALRDGDAVFSYRDVDAASREAAEHLAAAGVRAGDRVLVIAENCAAVPVLLFAIARLDAWSVIVNARLSPREVDAIREHCAPRVAVFTAATSPDAAAHAERHGGARPWRIAAIGEVLLGPGNRECAPEPVSADPARQVAALIYTTGTTGNPKGVMLTHRNLLFVAKVSSTLRRLGPGDRVYGVLPIAHVYGLASVCLGTLCAGACLQLEARFTPQRMLRALTQDGITVAQGVPTMYAKLVELIESAGARPSAPRLRFLYAGGSPLAPSLKADTERLFGLTLHNGYGLTETSPTVAQSRLDAPRRDTSVGTALPGVELRIVDAAGRDAAPGEPGELLVRGPNVMRGYYRNPELTRDTVDADGWLRTGDLARRDADGALFIVGRIKEMIIRSGFNVYPAEVEAVLNEHPAVLHSAVVGRAVPDNEEVVAFVELSPGKTMTPAELARFAAARLSPYKQPAEIVILPVLPASATGKVLKAQLRTLAQSRLQSALASPARERA